MFPWQSGSDGREESQRLHLNPRSGRWNPDSSARAHHVGIAVAYSAWKFYQVTGDLAYLIDYGAEMLAEIARFWVSRATYDEQRDRYSIRGVIGPDEFHSGYPGAPYDGIDNNAYTNVMAVWVIMRAFDALDLLPLPNRLDLRETLGLHGDELAHWDRRQPTDVRPVPRRRHQPVRGLWRVGGTGLGPLPPAVRQHPTPGPHPGGGERRRQPLQGFQAGRRADAALPDVGRRSCVNYSTGSATASCPTRSRKTVDYYLARTSHGSTLSGVVHTWVLARANRERAMEFFQQVLKSDVADIQGGTTLRRHSPGGHGRQRRPDAAVLHRAGNPSDRIILSPHWPETLGVLAFPIHYRGLHLHLRVSGKGVIISVDPRGVGGAEVECRGRVKKLTPGSTVRFRS